MRVENTQLKIPVSLNCVSNGNLLLEKRESFQSSLASSLPQTRKGFCSKLLQAIGDCFRACCCCFTRLRTQRTEAAPQQRRTTPAVTDLSVSSTQRESVSSVRYTSEQLREVNPQGMTRLHQACMNQNIENARSLIQQGAPIDLVDSEGYTPFLRACAVGNREIVLLLLDAGANLQATDAQQNNGLHLVSQGMAIYSPAASNLVVELVQRGVATDGFNAEGRTPLYYICTGEYRGLEGFIEGWIRAGAPLNPVDREGRLPLHLACERGLPAVVHRLLEAGVVVNQADPRERTPLHIAASRGALRHGSGGAGWQIVQDLLAHGADIDARDGNLSTPLHHACAQTLNEETVRGLVARGANFNLQDRNGWLPFHIATATGNLPQGVFNGQHVLEAYRLVTVAELMRGRAHPALAHYIETN